ncbi:MAG: hypothetical protein ABI599_11355 [Flavobacteriales bacterium]
MRSSKGPNGPFLPESILHKEVLVMLLFNAGDPTNLFRTNQNIQPVA